MDGASDGDDKKIKNKKEDHQLFLFSRGKNFTKKHQYANFHQIICKEEYRKYRKWKMNHQPP
jgi:hypothetical protein